MISPKTGEFVRQAFKTLCPALGCVNLAEAAHPAKLVLLAVRPSDFPHGKQAEQSQLPAGPPDAVSHRTSRIVKRITGQFLIALFQPKRLQSHDGVGNARQECQDET